MLLTWIVVLIGCDASGDALSAMAAKEPSGTCRALWRRTAATLGRERCSRTLGGGLRGSPARPHALVGSERVESLVLKYSEKCHVGESGVAVCGCLWC